MAFKTGDKVRINNYAAAIVDNHPLNGTEGIYVSDNAPSDAGWVYLQDAPAIAVLDEEIELA